MSFDNTTVKADKEIELCQDIDGSVEYPLSAIKFSSVYHLSLHFRTNFGSDQTKIYYIGFAGEFVGTRRDTGAVICTYEARPIPQDHKTDIPTGNLYLVS